MVIIKTGVMMKDPNKLKILLGSLSALEQLMNKVKCRWMVIGGVAASLLGKPRFTADVDAVALIEDEELPNILKIAEKSGIVPRLQNVLDFAKKNRVLLLKHADSNINIDLSLGLLPFEVEALKRRKLKHIGKVSFYLPAVEDLIIFKAVAHRPQDIIDIKEIVNNTKKLDKKHIKKNVLEFAGVLEMPEIWKDIESILYNKS